MPVSAIIPTLNEEQRLGETIDAAFAAGVAEVIVSDGGSTDGTIRIAEKRGARVLTGETIRATQMNAAAAAAAHDALLFVHADTLLPDGAAAAVERAIADGALFGGFRIAFSEGRWRLRYVAFMINLRTRVTCAPWGDQAQFADRSAFERIGGFPPFPIMEDYELARRMKRLSAASPSCGPRLWRATTPERAPEARTTREAGRIALLAPSVRTSGRRFLENGVLRTSITNWLIIAAYHLGVQPERLARWYR